MKKWKKIFAAILAISMMLNLNVVNLQAEEYVYLGILGNEGEFTYVYDGESSKQEDAYFEVPSGVTLSECGFKLYDPVYWTSARKFTGWEVWTYQEEYDDWLPLESAGVLTTAEAMEYPITEELDFVATWAGEDDDYYSGVTFDAYAEDAVLEVKEAYELDGETYTETYETSSWGFYLKQRGSIKNEMKDTFGYSYEIVSDPVRTGSSAKFEGWLEYNVNYIIKEYGDNYASYYEYELVSEKTYTTAEILNRSVAENDKLYTAKWSDMKIEDYYPEEKTVTLSAYDGNFYIMYEDDADYTTTISETVIENDTLNEIWNEYNAEVSIENDACSELKDWTLYTYEAVFEETRVLPDGEVPKDTAERKCFLTYADEEYEYYYVLYNAEKLSKTVSTEELYNMPITENIFAVANWETDHVGAEGVRYENVVEPTSTKPGYQYKAIYCEECGKTISSTKEVIPCPNYPENPFTDIDAEKWYYSYIMYVYENGLMTGTGDGTVFSPDMDLSRSQFATILWRMNGSPEVEYRKVFADVPDGQWYTDAILWANQEGIVLGKGNGTFGVTDNISREQMALMMYRYANIKEYDVSQEADLSAFSDNRAVSVWAKESMEWAVANQIINGKGNGKLDPLGNASRAECATIIKNFMNAYN